MGYCFVLLFSSEIIHLSYNSFQVGLRRQNLSDTWGNLLRVASVAPSLT